MHSSAHVDALLVDAGVGIGSALQGALALTEVSIRRWEMRTANNNNPSDGRKRRPLKNPTKLTNRQNQVLAFILRHRVEHGYPPTRKEIMAEFKFRSPNSVQGHVAALVDKGYIELRPNKARGIVLKTSNSVPVLRIDDELDGQSLLAASRVEQSDMGVDANLFRPAASFFVRIPDSSMSGFGLHEGHVCAIARANTCSSSTIALVQLNGVLMLRQVHRDMHMAIRLTAVDLEGVQDDCAVAWGDDSFTIEGVAVGHLSLNPPKQL